MLSQFSGKVLEITPIPSSREILGRWLEVGANVSHPLHSGHLCMILSEKYIIGIQLICILKTVQDMLSFYHIQSKISLHSLKWTEFCDSGNTVLNKTIAAPRSTIWTKTIFEFVNWEVRNYACHYSKASFYAIIVSWKSVA